MLVIDAFHARCVFNLKKLILTLEIVFLWKVLMIQIDLLLFFSALRFFFSCQHVRKGKIKPLGLQSSVLSTDHSSFHFELIMKDRLFQLFIVFWHYCHVN